MLLPLLFHFNQHLNEHALLASHVCYRGLLRTLRANPAIKANIHISGTLLTALKWLDPEPLEMIRDGLTDGQFELVGSTFAQNVPYATNDWDNVRQMELHQKVLHDTFGLTPTAFWNPERCWRQSLVPIIARAGYCTITLEDHILEASGGLALSVYQTRTDKHTLNIVRDDEKLKHLFNFAAWFGDSYPLLTYLDNLPPSPRERDAGSEGVVLCYAEDAEAMGLWGYFHGVIPQQTWDRLDILLKTLATRNNIHTIHFAQIPEPTTELTPIADGAAAWMNASLAQEGLPYHEDGYTGWFDFNARAPKLATFRAKHTLIRTAIQKTDTTLPEAARLHALALHCFLTHQYEFGCIGIGGLKMRGWSGMHAAFALSNIAGFTGQRPRLTSESSIFGGDLNQDGHGELKYFNDQDLAATTYYGGRLLYWADLRTGQLRVGNPSAVVPGKYEADSVPPPQTQHPNFWLPDKSSYAEFDQREEAPTRLAKFLPAWVWENYGEPITLAAREMRLEGEAPYLTAQQGAFCDEISVDNVPRFSREQEMDFAEEFIHAWYVVVLDPTLTLEKWYFLEADTVGVRYVFKNAGDRERHIHWTTTSELALDYAALLDHGRAALAFLPDQPGVTNPLTGETLRLIADRAPTEFSHTPALLGLSVGLTFDLALAPGETETVYVRLVIERNN
ncbi:MAG: hypothetical protein H6636_03530 [Anaerolineales bacterium]|nr:hypothetical protein [Anaerolineales bacterium]